ncbi:MAG TPA: fumarate hydratase [Victivallales bacterium]|nr:fumarate hydratase [Victivallales bacterium]
MESANFATAKTIIEPAILTAVQKATSEAFLRANTISSLTGKPCSNISEISPQIEFKINPALKRNSVTLLMKGGGSENIGSQYSLPDEDLNAERDINGIKKVIIDSVINAQGKACPPGAIGVCIGGDRASGYYHAKKLFLRKIGERNKTPQIASLEIEMLKKINSLGIGPQGLGGKTFALELFITFLPRHPASFFVTISHMCWAWRRGKIFFD